MRFIRGPAVLALIVLAAVAAAPIPAEAARPTVSSIDDRTLLQPVAVTLELRASDSLDFETLGFDLEILAVPAPASVRDRATPTDATALETPSATARPPSSRDPATALRHRRE